MPGDAVTVLPMKPMPQGRRDALGRAVDAFIDFLCPYCRRPEQSSGPGLATMLAEHRITRPPMNFLDQASTTRYSTRAAAASGCADSGRFLEYTHALVMASLARAARGW